MENQVESRTAEQPNPGGTFLAKLSKVEIGAGIVIMAWTFGGVILRRFGIGPELEGIWGLTPMLFGWCGITLLLAGGGIQRYPAFPYLLHGPLFIWLVIVVLAFA
jgi:hypothetical protein